MNYERMRSCANKLASEKRLGSDFTEGAEKYRGRCQEIKPRAINLGRCKCGDFAMIHSSPDHFTKLVDGCLFDICLQEENFIFFFLREQRTFKRKYSVLKFSMHKHISQNLIRISIPVDAVQR